MESGHSNRIIRLLDKFLGGSVMTMPQLLSLIFPLFLDQLFVRVISMLNTSMISSYGMQAISAVSMVDSVNNFTMNLFIAISTGCTVVVAQFIGRGDRDSANLTVAQSITSSTLIAVIITVSLLVFTNPIINLLFGKGDDSFLDYAVLFMRASAISYPFFAIIQTALGAMRGSGNTKTSVYFSTSLSVLNVVLNILFLFVFRFGVLGLSISLIISRVAVAIVVMIYVLRSNSVYPLKLKHFFKLNKPIQGSVMTVAVPTGLEQVFFHGGRILTQIFIVGFGTESTAANAVVMPFSAFLQLIGATLMMAIVTIAGQCVGAGKVDEARWYIRRITWASVIGTAFLGIIFMIFLPVFLGFFDLTTVAYEKARVLCLMNVVFTPLFWSHSFVLPNGLRAAGDARYTSLVALIAMWTVRVLAAYILGVVLGFDVYGIWVAMFVEWLVRSILFSVRIKGNKWYHPVISD